MEQRRLKIFTWHIHGSYLYYLSQGNYDLYIPVNDQKTEGYYGRGQTFPFGDNVIEVPAAEVRNLSFDCILFQSDKNFLLDQFEVLSDAQRRLPRIYLEHNTPGEHPVNTLHILNDPDAILVHVTHFNKLMWKSAVPQVRVIGHGVTVPPVVYSGKLKRGVVVINHPRERGRIAGWDVYQEVARMIPLDLVGMGTGRYGGLGEVLHPELPAFLAQYRFLFNPMRYTSFGLAVCEAMMAGMPIVGLATTEYAAVLRDGYTGYIHSDIQRLVGGMQTLLNDPVLAQQLGLQAQAVAMEQFNIHRFVQAWQGLFHEAIDSQIITYGTDSFYQ